MADNGLLGLRERALDHLHELFVLEINTVIKTEITARPVGSLSHALFDLLRSYCAEADLAVETEDSRTVAHVLREVDRLQEATASDEALGVITCGRRIRSNCQELRRIFCHSGFHSVSDLRPGTALDDWMAHAMSAADQSRVRKMRDLGLEVVLCQTRVHLDGDIITRVARPLIEADNRKVLMELHSKGVERAVSFWGALGELGARLLGFALGGDGRGKA